MTENTNENLNSNNEEIAEIEALGADATQEQKDEYTAKIEDRNKQLYARLKKAEGYEFKDGKWVKPEAKPTVEQEAKTNNLSNADMYTLIKADVPEQDIQDVVEYATLKKISIADALKSPIVKNILKEKSDERKIEEGTHSGASRRGNTTVNDDTLLENARNGKMPENEADMDRLIAARLKAKKGK